jgi:CDP-paratose 2-epimerase
MRILITGGCGFLGSNLAAAALMRGDSLTILDNLSRAGASSNKAWLEKQGSFSFIHADTRNANDMDRAVAAVQPEAVFHVAGQVAMTTSLADPRKDFEINALGTLNLLEAVRAHSPNAAILYSSTNKVYGDLLQFTYDEQPLRMAVRERPLGFAEDTPLSFHSPYGCSKGAADQYMLDWNRMYGLKTVVFRHSSMYGGRQFATYDQGWIGWFCQKAIEQAHGSVEPFTISGSGKQVRDVLHAEDMVRLYFNTIEHITAAAGQAFNIGGGMANSLSLLELLGRLERMTGAKLCWKHIAARSSDQLVFVADVTKAERLLGWKPQIDVAEGLQRMLSWTAEQNAAT